MNIVFSVTEGESLTILTALKDLESNTKRHELDRDDATSLYKKLMSQAADCYKERMDEDNI